MRSIATWFTEVLNFRVLMVLAMIAGVLAMQAGRGTLAVFTDTASSTSNVFTSGVVDLKLTDANETALDAVTSSIGFASDMVPGDVVTARITVSSADGTTGQSVPARYAVTSLVASGSVPLAQRLDLLIGKRSSTDGAGTCDSTSTFGDDTLADAKDWVLIYQGDLADSSATPLKLIGDPAQGADTALADQISGDRSLAADGTEHLCFRVSFIDTDDNAAAAAIAGETSRSAHNYNNDDTDTDATDNDYQNLTATIRFEFSAEQTEFNP